MSNADQILIVGAVDCNDGVSTFLVSFSLGKPSRAAAEYGGPTVDVAGIGPVDTSALVESRFTVQVKAGSVDAVMAVVAAIAAELSDLSPITIGLKNSDQTGTLVPRVAECIEIPQESPWDSRLVNQNATQVEIIVRREPWVYGPADTLYTDEGFDLPAVIDLSLMEGQAPAPLNFELTAPGADLRCFWAGVYPDPAVTIVDFVYEMVGRTWAGTYGSDADAAGWPDGVPNTVIVAGDYNLLTTSIDTAGYVPGEYLVLARCKTVIVHGDVFCGASSVEAEMLTAHVESTTLEWYPLGVVSLPTQTVRGSEAAPLYIGIKGMTPGTVCINCVAIVPVTWGMVGWHDPASHCHTLVYEDGMVYADDVAGLSKAVGRRQLRALGGCIVAVGGRSSTPGPTLHTHWTL